MKDSKNENSPATRSVPQGENLSPTILVNPERDQLRRVVADAQARLAEFEFEYTKEKARVDVMQAVLFRLLREHYEKRDRLRLLVDYRNKFLNSLVRGGEEDAKKAEDNYEEARQQSDKDYEETAATMAEKKQLTAEEGAELIRHWKKLVKMYHPDRFANQPDKLATYQKLTSAINAAKDSGNINILKEIAEDPHGFILRQGWVALDLSDEAELAQLRRLNETLQLEIIAALEALNLLRESPNYELYKLSEQKPSMLDELVTKRAKLLDHESIELGKRAVELAKEIEELSGQMPSRIV